MYMKARFIAPLIACVVLTIGSIGTVWGSSAPEGSYFYMLTDSPYNMLGRFDQSAAALYEAAYSNNRHAGYIHLQKLKRYMEDGMLDAFGNVDGWLAVQQAAASIEKALGSKDANSGWMNEAAQIRLAADALVRPGEALWLQYEKLLREDANRIRLAWNRYAGDNVAAASAMLVSMQDHMNRIEPAARMYDHGMRTTELVERIQYMGRLLESKRVGTEKVKAEVDRTIIALDSSVSRMFQEHAAAAPVIAVPAKSNPIGWALFLGAIICAALAYSGWRKYKQLPFGIKRLH